MTSTNDLAFEAAIDRVVRGERVSDPTNEGELQAARFMADALPDLLPAMATRARVLRRVHERISAKSRARWRLGAVEVPAFRLRAVPLAAVLLVGVLAGGAYALPVLLPQILGLNDPSAVEVLQSGRAHEVHVSQTVAGVTITTDRVYADAHRVVVQFTVENPPADLGQPLNQGQRVKSPMTTRGSLTLTDSAGRTYPQRHGVESPLISAAGWNGEPLIGVYTFDASQIPEHAGQVSLQLTIAELRGVSDTAGSASHVPGPWVFTFTVPVSR